MVRCSIGWTLLILLISLCPKVGAGSQIKIDQIRGPALLASYYFISNSAYGWQQEVVVGKAGQLVGIDILPRISTEVSLGASALFYINAGSAWQSDQNEFAQIILMADATDREWFHIDVSAANFDVSPGDIFVWGIEGISGTTLLYGQQRPDYPGRLWLDSPRVPLGEHPSNGMAFQTHVLVVPEPDSVFMLGSLIVVSLANSRFCRPA
jgi:hypothetical protein